MNKYFSLLLIVPFMACCKNSERESAANLLDDARTAVKNKQFDVARSLIDSLRSAYPKEIDVRKCALAFSDTIELENAKYEYVEADSIYVFKQLELEDVKKHFVLERNEKYQTKGFYLLPKYVGSKSSFSFFPEVEESGKLLLVSISSDRKYNFHEVDLENEDIDNLCLRYSLSASAKSDVFECLKLAVAMRDVKVAGYTRAKLDTKIRFFETKIMKQKME